MAKFKPGESGNLNGRPRNTGHRQKLFNAFIEPHRKDLFEKALSMALDGNEAMLRLFMDRMLPTKPVDNPIQFDLPEGEISNAKTLFKIGLSVIKGVSDGSITPDEAHKVSALLGVYQKVILEAENSHKIDELKAEIDKDRHDI